MAEVSVDQIRRRISDWLRSVASEANAGHRIPPIPSPRLLQDANTWKPSSGHLARIRDEKDYNGTSNRWGLAPYYYEGPGAYELQHVHGMCGCRYVTLRRVAVLIDKGLQQPVAAEDCEEPVWGQDIREASRWQIPETLYAEIGLPLGESVESDAAARSGGGSGMLN